MSGAARRVDAAGDRAGGASGAPGRLPRREVWARIATIAVALALFVVGSVLGATIYGGPLLLVFLFVLLQSGALVLSTIRPRAAAIISGVAIAGIAVVANAGGHPWPWSVTTLITQTLIVGNVGYRKKSWIEGVVVLAGSVAIAGAVSMLVPTRRTAESVAVDLVVFVSVAGSILIAGIVLQRWEAIRHQLVRERQVRAEERARRSIAEEKTRIARELHDVIAHSMSIINVQATSAPYRLEGVTPELRQEFEQMAASSRHALAEMRSLLSVLREEDGPRELAPLPGLRDLPELISTVTRSGTRITMERVGESGDDDVSEIVGLAAYRIVQEAVSNAIRHAPGARIDVRCEREHDALALTIANTSAPRADAILADGAGHGLIGMRERAASVGGTLELRTEPGGGFVVRARLPLHPEAPAEPPAASEGAA